jgi:hypothetical protein
MNIMVGFSSISPFFFLTFLLLLEAPSFSVASDEAPAEAEREDVVVNTVYGRLRGFSTDVVVDQQQAREGEHSTQRVNVFLGVPFARPPVGDLRFEVGVLSLNYNYIIYNIWIYAYNK